MNGGFYQPVNFDVQRVIAGKSSMSLVVDGKATPLVLGDGCDSGVAIGAGGEGGCSAGVYWVWIASAGGEV